MRNKIGKTRKKPGRPTVKEQINNKELLAECFDRGYSITYAARLCKLNKNTVWHYYSEFREKLIEEVNEEFIKKQKHSKEACLYGLDGDLQRLEEEIQDIDKNIKACEKEGKIRDEATFRSQKHNLIINMANIRQQKSDIECSPTLDVSLEQMIKDRVAEEDDEDDSYKPLGK